MEIRTERFELPAGFSGYDLWSRTLAPVSDEVAAQMLQPVTIRLTNGLTDGGRSSLAAAIRDGVILIEGPDRRILGDYFGIPSDDKNAPEPNYENALRIVSKDSRHFVSWKPADQRRILESFGDLFDVVEYGPLVFAPSGPVPTPVAPPLVNPPQNGEPLVAVIDDGIGFLNIRFRRDETHTRFHAIWLQSPVVLAAAPYGVPHPLGGIVLYRHHIDAILAAGPTLIETDIYHALNAVLVPADGHPSLEMGFTHGTHVADLCGGDDPANPTEAADWPLIGVQLASVDVDQTAGWKLTPSIRAAVRWVLEEALPFPQKSPLLVNLSFGNFAGPKDGTGMIEADLAAVTADWQTVNGRRAQIAYPYGNFRRTRQLANYVLGGKLETLFWHLPPDNRESCFAEIHANPHGGVPADPTKLVNLKLEIRPPGANTVLNVPIPPVGSGHYFLEAVTGKKLGFLAHMPAVVTAPGRQQPPYLLFGFAPTCEFLTVAMPAMPGVFFPPPAGAWELRMKGNPKPNQLPLRIEVQRSDTPIGYPLKGRQSWLDHPDSHCWEMPEAAYSLPDPACPISREGTHSAFTTATPDVALNVVAMRGDPCELPVNHRAARYSSLGSTLLRTSPDVAAYGERSAGRPGLLASGTFSGGTRTSNGTSAACALVTRMAAKTLNGTSPLPMTTAADKQAHITDLMTAMGAATAAAEHLPLGAARLYHMEYRVSPLE
ncbi:MAG: S8 family serine peptidase [Paracoccaceae bacterium]